jgi:aspartyl-tRNA(Asn)/glutamyl-tRNA(Gln) amidotransferase subunit C
MFPIEQVRKVAHLARLQLTPEEENKFVGQLGDILDYFEQLRELDTEKVAPTTRAIELSNIMRADDLKPFVDRDDILNIAPEQDGDFFKVPKILHDE